MSVFNNFKSKSLKSVVGTKTKTKGVLSSNILKTTKIKNSLLSKFPKAVIESQTSAVPTTIPALNKIGDSRIVSVPNLVQDQTDRIRNLVGDRISTTVPTTTEPEASSPSTSGTPTPDLESVQPILETGTSIEPTFSSSQQSVLFLPSLATSEKFFGNVLEALEKPRIVGVLENEMTTNGIPKECVLFIKRLDTSKYMEEKYTIFRRATFYENEYYEIGSLTGEQISMDKKYAAVASENFPSQKNLITFVDTNINAHQSYSYKIKVNYRKLTDQEVRNKSLSGRLSGLNLIDNLGVRLFNPDGEE